MFPLTTGTPKVCLCGTSVVFRWRFPPILIVQNILQISWRNTRNPTNLTLTSQVFCDFLEHPAGLSMSLDFPKSPPKCNTVWDLAWFSGVQITGACLLLLFFTVFNYFLPYADTPAKLALCQVCDSSESGTTSMPPPPPRGPP